MRPRPTPWTVCWISLLKARKEAGQAGSTARPARRLGRLEHLQAGFDG